MSQKYPVIFFWLISLHFSVQLQQFTLTDVQGWIGFNKSAISLQIKNRHSSVICTLPMSNVNVCPCNIQFEWLTIFWLVWTSQDEVIQFESTERIKGNALYLQETVDIKYEAIFLSICQIGMKWQCPEYALYPLPINLPGDSVHAVRWTCLFLVRINIQHQGQFESKTVTPGKCLAFALWINIWKEQTLVGWIGSCLPDHHPEGDTEYLSLLQWYFIVSCI